MGLLAEHIPNVSAFDQYIKRGAVKQQAISASTLQQHKQLPMLHQTSGTLRVVSKDDESRKSPEGWKATLVTGPECAE